MEKTNYDIFFASGAKVSVSIPERIFDEVYPDLVDAIYFKRLFNQCGWDSVEIKMGENNLTVLNCQDVIGWN